MHRTIACLLALLMCAACALAEPDTPYDPATLVRYHAQPDAVRTVVDCLYQGAARYQTQVTLPEGTRYDDAKQAVQVLLTEFPELWHLSTNAAISYYRDTPEFATAVTLAYTVDAAAYEAAQARLMNAAHAMLTAAPEDDYAAALHLHDALADRATYAADLAEPSIYTAYGALVNGSAVCEGYAQALTLLYRMAGIHCSMATGSAVLDGATVRHAWNVVRMDGRLLLTDCTLNDQDASGALLHWYFLLPAQDAAHTHRHEQPELTLSDNTAWTFHARTNSLVAEAADVRRVLLAQLEDFCEEGRPMELRAANPDLMDTITYNASALLGDAGISTATVYANQALCIVTIAPGAAN